MKTELKAKLLQQLLKKNINKGFTLIELLVVVIIIGVLAAVALPNLLGQVGKAREAEGKNGIGTLNRSQQAYHTEKQTFAAGSNFDAIEALLGVNIDQKYFNFAGPGTASTAFAAQTATPIQATTDGVRPYAGGVSFNAGAYATNVCQGNTVAGAVPTVTTTASCPDGSTLLK